MGYSDHFKLADDLIAHLDKVISLTPDPFIASRYVGFIAVAAVTVYELAIKEIFITFAEKKHKIFGNFAETHFDRINGRIKPEDIQKRYLKRFGEKYSARFARKINALEKDILQSGQGNIRSSYGNIITWRNQFAHTGDMPSTATYCEVKKSYRLGKKLIKCLAETMVR